MSSFYQQWQQQQELSQNNVQDQWDNSDSSLRNISSGETFSSLQISPATAGISTQGFGEQNKNASGPSSSTLPPSQKPRTRARRGQATDPHSIAERLRRERIADRMKALQELVPNSNKMDRAAMLDDIIEYVRFLQLQVKILGMSESDNEECRNLISFFESIPKEVLTAAQESTGLNDQQRDLTERQVSLLMEQDMVSAMQYLQSKGLCLLPASLASSLFKNQENDNDNSSHSHSNSNNSNSNSQNKSVGNAGGSAGLDLSMMDRDGNNMKVNLSTM